MLAADKLFAPESLESFKIYAALLLLPPEGEGRGEGLGQSKLRDQSCAFNLRSACLSNMSFSR